MHEGADTRAEHAVDVQSALQLVFSQLSEQDLLCSISFVCKAWQAAASAEYGSRPMIKTSLQVHGKAKTASLAGWLQRHGRQLLQLEFIGFKQGVTASWWNSILSLPLSRLQRLSLRSCGVPDLALHLLQTTAPLLRSLKLEHAPCAPSADAIAGMTQLTSLIMRRCQLSLEHLSAVAKLPCLVVLCLPGNNFAQEPSRHPLSMDSGAIAAAAPDVAAAEADGAGGSHNSNTNCSPAHTSNGSNSSTKYHSSRAVGHLSTAADSIPPASQQQQQQPPQYNLVCEQSTGGWVTGLQLCQELDLSECKLQEGLLDQLPELTTLTRLCLSQANLDIKPGPVEATTAVDGTATQLRRLGITTDNAAYSQHVLTIGAGTAASCAVIGHMRQLLDLDVSYIQNACEQLCAAASTATEPLALKKVDVSYTGCTEQQMQQLMACCPNVKQINAGGNDALCSVGGCYM